MKKNIQINLYGTIYNIDEDAYALLQEYLESMKRYFSRQDGGEEIADDIEHRVAELLWEKKQLGVEAIDYVIIKEIIKKIGNPAEIDSRESDGDESKEETAQEEQQQNKSTFETLTDDANAAYNRFKGHFGDRHLYREPRHKLLGGVCGGLATYLGWGDAVFYRIVFILLSLFTNISGVIPYLIMWIIVPEARTPEDRLRQRGIEPTPENINEELLHGNAANAAYNNVPNNNTTWSGCLKGCLLGIICLVMIPVLFVIFILFIVCVAMGGAFLQETSIFLGNFADTHFTFYTISGLVATVILIGILIYAMMRMLRGKQKPVSGQTVTMLIVVALLCTIWISHCLGSSIGNLINAFDDSDDIENVVEDTDTIMGIEEVVDSLEEVTDSLGK